MKFLKGIVYLFAILVLTGMAPSPVQIGQFNAAPLLALVVGLVIQGPGFWLLGWLRMSQQANEWQPLKLEVKYVAGWAIALIVTFIQYVALEGAWQNLMGATWFAGVWSGIGIQSSVREVFKWFEGGE